MQAAGRGGGGGSSGWGMLQGGSGETRLKLPARVPGHPQAARPPPMGAGPGALLGGGDARGGRPGPQPAHPAPPWGSPLHARVCPGLPPSRRAGSQPQRQNRNAEPETQGRGGLSQKTRDRDIASVTRKQGRL